METENFDVSEEQFEASLATAGPPETASDLEDSIKPASAPTTDLMTIETDPAEWKEEVSRRVEGYRTRRGRGRGDRASRSIGFTFEPETAPPAPDALSVHSPVEPATAAFVETPAAIAVQVSAVSVQPEITGAAPPQLDGTTLGRLIETVRYVESRTAENKVIEFPHPEEPLIDLAEPLIMAPRIFEAEDVAEIEREHTQLGHAVAPPIATITLETPLTAEPRAAELELPLPVAPLRLRAWAAVFDLVIVASATVLFWLGCVLASGFPEGRAALATLIGTAAASWCAYQYLCWSRLCRTLGMRYIGLRVLRLDEKPITRKLLRARAVAAVLSSAALGLGFFWAFLDSDRLTWHDRITQTFVSER